MKPGENQRRAVFPSRLKMAADADTARLLGYRKWVAIPPILISLAYVAFLRHYSSRSRQAREKSLAALSTTSSSSKKPTTARVGVNKRFFEQMRKLLPILVPGPFSRESGLLVSLAGVLIARTWLDIWFSAFNGQVVKAIVSRNQDSFHAHAGIEFGLMMWPLSIVNNSLKLLINALSISFRYGFELVFFLSLTCL